MVLFFFSGDFFISIEVSNDKSFCKEFAAPSQLWLALYDLQGFTRLECHWGNFWWQAKNKERNLGLFSHCLVLFLTFYPRWKSGVNWIVMQEFFRYFEGLQSSSDINIVIWWHNSLQIIVLLLAPFSSRIM